MTCYTLSVCNVAGRASPTRFDLLEVSINSGTNFLLGLGDSSTKDPSEVLVGVGSGVGMVVVMFEDCFELRVVVSIGSGANRLFVGTSTLISSTITECCSC